MNKIIIIVGRSGSGKSTLETGLISLDDNKYSKIVSHTTRDPRKGEQDKVDYNFVDNAEFKNLEKADLFLEAVHFSGNSYGALKTEFTKSHHPIFVATPEGAVECQKEFGEDKCFIVHFDIPEDVLRVNMSKRGDSEESINKRLSGDNLDTEVKKYKLRPDLIISPQMLTDGLPVLVNVAIFTAHKLK